MDMPVNQFKRALRDNRTIYGTWLMSAAPSTAEALGCAGLDFLVVDMEHVPVDTPQMIELLRTVAGTPAAPVVRLPWNDMVMIKRALDGGAQSLMMPFVQNADEARRAVACTRYPPQGRRGAAFGFAHDDYEGGDVTAKIAALHARGDDDRGPYQSPMEDGMQHFHEWYRRRLGGTLR